MLPGIRPFPQLCLLVPSAEVEALRVTLTLLQRLVSWVTVEKRLSSYSEEGLESVVSAMFHGVLEASDDKP